MTPTVTVFHEPTPTNNFVFSDYSGKVNLEQKPKGVYMENTKNTTGNLFVAPPLSESDFVKLKEATNLLDEAYNFALMEDNYLKSYDGTIQVNISYGTYSDRINEEDLEGNDFTKPTVTFTVWAYIIGDLKRNDFTTADEMLETIKRWHSCEKQRSEELNK